LILFLQRSRFDAISSAVSARLAILLATCCAFVACTRTPERAAPPPGSEQPVALEAAPQSDAGDWARHVGSADPVHAGARDGALEARAAVMNDDAEDSDELADVVRLVYRMRFTMPSSFHDRSPAVAAPAGELQVDASQTRLRARFVGPGWPVQEGSEVRLRADLPGVYLFDGHGGRSLGPGQLAWWFEGQLNGRAQTMVGVRKNYGRQPATPLEVPALCMLLAEWSNEPRNWLVPRCLLGSPPPGFKLGAWSADLTAVVPMQVPRRVLRADQAKPPQLALPPASAGWLEAPAVARLAPLRPDPLESRGALVIENHTETRAVVIAQGVALGWVDAGATLRVDGLRAGFYRVGAIRPLGILRMAPNLVHVPGLIAIGPSE
jgi:hypothetical protein